MPGNRGRRFQKSSDPYRSGERSDRHDQYRESDEQRYSEQGADFDPLRKSSRRVQSDDRYSPPAGTDNWSRPNPYPIYERDGYEYGGGSPDARESREEYRQPDERQARSSGTSSRRFEKERNPEAYIKDDKDGLRVGVRQRGRYDAYLQEKAGRKKLHVEAEGGRSGTVGWESDKVRVDVQHGDTKGWLGQDSDGITEAGVSKDGAGMSYSREKGIDIASGAKFSYSRDGFEVSTPFDQTRSGSGERSEVYAKDDIKGSIGGFNTSQYEGYIRDNNVSGKYEAFIGGKDAKSPSAKFTVGEGHREANVRAGGADIHYKRNSEDENLRIMYGEQGFELSNKGEFRVITGAEASLPLDRGSRSTRGPRSTKRRSRNERYSDDE